MCKHKTVWGVYHRLFHTDPINKYSRLGHTVAQAKSAWGWQQLVRGRPPAGTSLQAHQIQSQPTAPLQVGAPSQSVPIVFNRLSCPTSAKLPNLPNPNGTACYMNSSLQFFAEALNDEFLNHLMGIAPPTPPVSNDSAQQQAYLQAWDRYRNAISMPADFNQEQQQAYILAWNNLRWAFCSVMKVLREPQTNTPDVLHQQYIDNLSQALNTVIGYHRGQLFDRRYQHDPTEFMVFLSNFLGIKHRGQGGDSLWKGAARQEILNYIEIGHVEISCGDGRTVRYPIRVAPIQPEKLPIDGYPFYFAKLQEGVTPERYYDHCRDCTENNEAEYAKVEEKKWRNRGGTG